MSRFYADISGGRGTATRQGHAASGIRGHVRGWQCGVRTVGRADGDIDIFEIYATGGSSGDSYGRLLGTVTIEDGTPTFTPHVFAHVFIG